MVYNTENNLMKWDRRTETAAKAVLDYYVCKQRMPDQYFSNGIKGLMFGNNMEMLYELLTGTGGSKHRYFCLDDTFDKFLYLTNDKHGYRLLQMLCNSNVCRELDVMLCTDLHPRNIGMLIENDAVDDSGNPVLFSYLIDMPRLARFTSGLRLHKKTGTVICFDFQKTVLSKYCGEQVTFDIIDFDKFERYFLSSRIKE